MAYYQSGPGQITVTFTSGRSYTYTDAVTGAHHVAAMQRLAAAGRGLASYVSRNRGMAYV